MKIIKYSLIMLLGIHFSVLADRGTSIEMSVDAEMLAKIVIYYKGVDVTSGELNFPLSVDSDTRKFANTSDNFYLVGNVTQAKIIMEDSPFELVSANAGGAIMPLNGYFTMNSVQTNAETERIVPVLRRLNDGNNNNGLKVTFESKDLASNYGAGVYSGKFTLILTPIL
ncbi:hypothetical protein [Pragia fontium]|uniref:hypothetical protein n=1 Tax=Pragia fontium TaxID=82985 RepID=UPI0011877128|nr:hypothetical protein [Pragia fontium]